MVQALQLVVVGHSKSTRVHNMKTVKEVLTMAMDQYTMWDFMCHVVDDLKDQCLITYNEHAKTLSFIKSKITRFTLTDHLSDTSTVYAALMRDKSGEFRSWENAPAFEYRAKWWREVIESPEANV